MMSDSTYRCLTLWTLVVLLACVVAQDYSLEDNLRELLSRRKNLGYVRQLVDDMDNQLNRLHKTACHLRIFGIDCDYGDIGGNFKNQNAWDNEGLSNKRSRAAAPCYKIGNPEGCLGKKIDEEKKDTTHWGNPDSPGKK